MVIWICSTSAETYFIFLEKLIDQDHRWDWMDGEGSWPEPGPNHRPLPCDCESPPAFGQQQQQKNALMERFVVTRCVQFQRKMTQTDCQYIHKCQYVKTCLSDALRDGKFKSCLQYTVNTYTYILIFSQKKHKILAHFEHDHAVEIMLQTHQFHTFCLCSQLDRHSGKCKNCPGYKSHHAGKERSCKL